MSIKHRDGPPWLIYYNDISIVDALPRNDTFYYTDNWEGYAQQKNMVFLGPLGKEKMDTVFKRVVGKYPLHISVKGGSEIFNSPYVYYPSSQ